MGTILTVLQLIGTTLILYVLFTTLIALFVHAKILSDKQGLNTILGYLQNNNIKIIISLKIIFRTYYLNDLIIVETPSFLFPYLIEEHGLVFRFTKTYKLIKKTKLMYTQS